MANAAPTWNISDLPGHVGKVARELSEWDYEFAGYDGAGAAIMRHPYAGTVRIHKSPTSKSGARKSCLSLARQQLRHAGVTVSLPWRPDQPKVKEAPMATAVAPDKVKLNAASVRERIDSLARTGTFGDEFQTKDVYEYLEGKYILPSYSGDGQRQGSVAVSQSLQRLVRQGSLYREQKPTELGKRWFYRSALTEKIVDIGEKVDPPKPIELVPAPVPHIEAPVVEVPTGEPVTEPEPEQPAPPQLPAEALELLRGYFVGDMEAENELLREALTTVTDILTGAAAQAVSALEALSEGRPVRAKRAKHDEGNIGPRREARLAAIIAKCPHNVEINFREIAELSGLRIEEAGNALSSAVRLGWKSVDGHYITNSHRRGMYTIVEP